MKKVLKILFGIVCSICIVIGGYKLVKQIEYNQMVEIVKSDEVKEIIESELRRFDENALMEKGYIKTYQISDTTIRCSPMGGILFDVYLNGDSKLLIHFTLEKTNGLLQQSGGGYSEELSTFLKENILNND
ncbi:DUF1310 domain-containing protein [Streptococcus suis]|nr:DUF1310 domain-containing protein [Streptococcus suis]